MKQARIDEAISDVGEPNVKVRYWALVVLFGQPESEEGLKEAEDTLQAGIAFFIYRWFSDINCLVSDLRFSDDNTFLVDNKFSLADIVLAALLALPVVIGRYELSKKFPKLQSISISIYKVGWVVLWVSCTEYIWVGQLITHQGDMYTICPWAVTCHSLKQ